MQQLEIWGIYYNPPGFLNQYVSRKFIVRGKQVIQTQEAQISSTLKPLRDSLSGKGLVKIPRSATDDPTVVETWI